MNTPLLLCASVLAAAGTAAAVVWFDRPTAAAEAAPNAAALEARVAGLETKLNDLGERLERATTGLNAPAARSAVPSLDTAVIEAAVTKALAARGTANGAGAADAPAVALTKEQALLELRAMGGDMQKMQALWRRVAQAGIEADVIKHYEDLALAAPTDAMAQYGYGAILLAGIQTKTPGEQAQLAIKADAAFDKTLKLDERHWPARFTKATSLSFWPKITGKQAEALRQFEVLVEQQEQGKVEPHFVQTYLFLGNLHLGNGDHQKAQAAYERGLRWFPDHAELKQQLAATKK